MLTHKIIAIRGTHNDTFLFIYFIEIDEFQNGKPEAKEAAK